MRGLLALAVVPLLVVATACSGDSSDADASSTTSTDTVSAATGQIDDIHVTLPKNGPPTATFPKPFSVDSTQVKVLDPGDGPKVVNGATVLTDLVAYNGTTADMFDNSYATGTPETFGLVDQQMLPGIISGLVGQDVGSTVLLVVPAAEAFGSQGNQQYGIAPTDTIIFVMTLHQVSDPHPLPMATGKSSPLPATVPDLELDGKGQPSKFVSNGKVIKSPTKLGVYTVIKGTGPPVRSGDLLTLQYLGQIYPDGTVFDNSWSTGPRIFQLGEPLIKGWMQGLTGQRVGSRVVLVVPPAFGYGKSGNADIHATATTTLIFAVDILGTGRS